MEYTSDVRRRFRRRPNVSRSSSGHHRVMVVIVVVALTLLSADVGVWQCRRYITLVRAHTVDTTAEQQQQQQEQPQQPPPNVFEQMWHKLQQATSQASSTTRKRMVYQHHQQHHRSSSSDTDSSQETMKPPVATTKPPKASSSSSKDETEERPPPHPMTKPHNPLARPTQQRRHALYRHSLSSHYGEYASAAAAADTTASGIQTPDASTTTTTTTAFTTTTMDAYQTAWETYYGPQSHRSIDETTADSRRLDRTTSLHTAWPPLPRSKVWSNRALVRRMFQHGYDSYLEHGFFSDDSAAAATATAGEIHPVSCQPGTFHLVPIPALTLLDSLDTLLVMHNTTEFARACERLRHLEQSILEQYRRDHEHPYCDKGGGGGTAQKHVPMSRQHSTLFALNQNVSVFETNIRVLGGLLSAHQLALAMRLDRSPLIEPSDYTTNDGSRENNEEEKESTLEFMARHGIDPVRMADVFTTTGAVAWGPLDDSTTTTTTTTTTSLSSDPTDVRDMDRLSSDDDDDDNAASLSRVSICAHSRSLSEYDCLVQLDGVLLGSALSAKKNYTRDAADESALSTDYWRYDGYLLELALDIGTRLLPAFSTPTGIPYGTVNLLYGVPSGETPIASLAGGGTLTLEFELLSRLTGDVRFGKAAKLASRALFRHRSQPLNLFGKHIDTRAGTWTESLSGIGSNSDSFIEYLAKQYILFPEDDDFWIMLKTAYAAIFAESRFGEWYADVEMTMGTTMGTGRRVLESLAAFYPGLQVLLGEIAPAARSLNSFFMVREVLGFLPERFNYGAWNLDTSREGSGIHPLRPELLESCYFMHQATKGIKASASFREMNDNGADVTSGSDSETPMDQASGWQWAADFALHKLERTTRTKCGYASLRELKPQTTGSVDNTKEGVKHLDEMPSYFLSETLKYLYLTFDDDNFLHRDDNHEWIFTTEAHPIHNVPVKRTPKTTTEFSSDVAALKKVLKDRLNEKRKAVSSSTQSALSKNVDLVKEKWTSIIDYRSYRDDIDGLVSNDVSDSQKGSGVNRTGVGSADGLSNWILSIVPPGPYVQDEFKESYLRSNTAHFSLGNWGSGRNLRKACRNVYSSHLWWMHALNGGSTDYSDTYISVGQDVLVDNVHSFTLLGAVDALGALGSGVYFGEKDNENDLCLTVFPKESTQPAAENSNPSVTEGSIVFPTDIGNFEIETYANGVGFQIHREASRETLKVNVLHDFDDTIDALVMVFSELRSGLTQPDTSKVLEKKVSIADFEGNTFTCEITVFREFTSDPDVDGEIDDSRNETLLTVPCSPSLFGPSRFSLLKTQDEILVESTLDGPSAENQFGCHASQTVPHILDSFVLIHGKDRESEDNAQSDETIDSLNPDESVQHSPVCVVKRGECSFYNKAFIAKSVAKAVIVINNVDDEVFMMASSEDEAKNIDPLDLPLAVLVSGIDGEALLHILNEEVVSATTTFARIFIKRKVIDSENLDVRQPGSISWPIVQGRTDFLEILVENGWGVRGSQVDANDKKEWQLHFLRHGLGADDT